MYNIYILNVYIVYVYVNYSSFYKTGNDGHEAKN